MVPVDAVPPVTLFTCHCTAVLLEPVTVAWNCCVPLAGTVAEVGEIAILTTGPPSELLLPEPPPQAVQTTKRMLEITTLAIEMNRRDMEAP
jgi:hypothetical protein